VMTEGASSPSPAETRRSTTVLGVFVALFGLTTTVVALALRIGTDVSAAIVLGVSTWYLVGAVIVARRGNNVVGWLFVAIGLLWTTGFASNVYTQLTTTQPGPGLTWASWYGAWFWIPGIGLPLVLILVFPTGRVPSPAWRPVLIFILVGCLLGSARLTLAATFQGSGAAPEVRNPIGISRLGRTEFGAEGPILLWLLAAAVATLASFVVRFRRSKAVERQQLKWMAYLGTPVFIVGWFIGITLSELGFEIGDFIGAVTFAAIPLAALMAITRSRLYEIDRILSRTASYAVVTGVLVGVYAVVVTSVTRLLPQTSSAFAVAAATLAAAAAFRPLLARVQQLVDRRFDRERFDGMRAAAAFSDGLRDETDPAVVATEMTAVVQRTLQPERLILWVPGGVTDER
jgi:hypothetical protein